MLRISGAINLTVGYPTNGIECMHANLRFGPI